MATRTNNVTLDDCARHVVELCNAFKIRVRWATDFSQTFAFDTVMNPELRAVSLMAITTMAAYATALHEIGHIMHPTGALYAQMSPAARALKHPLTEEDFRLDLLQERSAWAWAMDHALTWDVEMTMTRNICYGEYLKRARKFGVMS